MARSQEAKTRRRGKSGRPDKGAPAPAASRGVRRLGIELDGGVAHVVSVGADGAVEYTRVDGSTDADALAEVLKYAGRSDSVQVALTSAHQSVRRLEIPNVPTSAVPVAMRAVAEEQLPMAGGRIAVAGLRTDAVGADGPVMTIAAVPGNESAPLLRQLDASRPMTVSAFLLPADGLYLRVARSTAELVLIREGAPAAVRALQCGGVSGLLEGGYADSSTVYLGATSGNVAVDAYVDSVVSDVRRTIVFWRREGTNVPDQLTVIGEGAALPSLAPRLRDASYEVIPVPTPQGLNFDHVQPEDRPVAFQALAASLMDLQAQPFAGLLDDALSVPKVAQDKSRLPVLVVGIAGSVIVLMLAFGAFLKFQAEARLDDAKAGAEQSQQQLSRLAPYSKLANDVGTGRTQVGAIKDAEPATAPIIRALFATAPAGTRIESFTLARPSVSVFSVQPGEPGNSSLLTGSVTATMPDNGDPAFRPVADWQDAFLKAQAASLPTGAQQANVLPRRDAWAGSMTRVGTEPGEVKVSFSYTLAQNAFKPASTTPAGSNGGTK